MSRSSCARSSSMVAMRRVPSNPHARGAACQRQPGSARALRMKHRAPDRPAVFRAEPRLLAQSPLCSNVAMASRTNPELSPEQAALLRRMPSVDELLLRPGLLSLCREVERSFVVETTRAVLDGLRGEITSGEAQATDILNPAAIEERIVNAVHKEFAPSLQPVINASGVILHTNLGRAPLSAHVVEEFRRTATQYSNLEYDLSAGARGRRDVHTARLIERLTAAESAIVVNNCAAAVLLALAALARGGEVIVSRGELIEIGDGFRIPEIMEQSGAILREVGTTNRTRIADYENAIGEKTRVMLRVHPSNFEISGFAEKPTLEELAELSQRVGIPLVEDLGSGCLVDISEHGISEPTVRQSIEAGAGIVMFSGDKLLGGPQAGIIAGKKELIARVRRHPLFRALRVDKLTIAALEATLGAYLRAAWEEIPAMRMIRATPAELKRRAENFLRELRPELPLDEVEIEIADGTSLAGGGSTPSQ